MRRLASVVVLTAIALLTALPSPLGAQPAPEGGHTAHGVLTTAQQPTAVRIVDFGFSPRAVTVAAGSTVTWTNTGNARHTATSDNGVFDSKNLSNGGAFNFRFDTPGTFAYHCDIHPSMTGTVTVQAAQQAAPAATATPAPAAAASATPAPGAIGGEARGALGSLGFGDGQGQSDQARLEIQGLTPQSGVTVTGWLVAANGDAVRLGELNPDAGGKASLSYTDRDKRNLIGLFDRVVVTAESSAGGTKPSGTELMRDEASLGAFVHIRHLLARFDTTPANTALATGLLSQATLAAERALQAKRAADANDLAGVRTQLEQVVNLIEGEKGASFGDLNGDERRDNPGDGFGLLNYAAASAEHAQLAIDAAPRDETVKVHGGHVIASAKNTSDWLTEARTLALPAFRAPNAAAVRASVERINVLLTAVLEGRDSNRDGRVDPIRGEGGARTAYDHAQLMATLEPTAAQAVAAPAPSPAPTTAPAVAAARAATVEPPASAPQAASNDDENSSRLILLSVGGVILLLIVIGAAAWVVTGRKS